MSGSDRSFRGAVVASLALHLLVGVGIAVTRRPAPPPPPLEERLIRVDLQALPVASRRAAPRRGERREGARGRGGEGATRARPESPQTLTQHAAPGGDRSISTGGRPLDPHVIRRPVPPAPAAPRALVPGDTVTPPAPPARHETPAVSHPTPHRAPRAAHRAPLVPAPPVAPVTRRPVAPVASAPPRSATGTRVALNRSDPVLPAPAPPSGGSGSGSPGTATSSGGDAGSRGGGEPGSGGRTGAEPGGRGNGTGDGDGGRGGSGGGEGSARREDPPAPPPPARVSLRVCAKSGLKPGKYCADTDERRFLESEAPDGRCTACKAPEPEPVRHHENRENAQTEAKLLRDSEPDLEAVREEGVTGTFTVVVRYTVGENGRVADVSVTRSSGHGALDDAVVRAVRRYRYQPATVDGRPRSVQLTRPIRISLSD